MKKFIHLIGILTVVLFSNVGNAQISDYEICDVNADGYGAFNLTTKIDEILDGADPSDYLITFHEEYDNAQFGANAIINPTSYFNIVPYIQVMYVRVENLNDSTFVVDSFNLVVYLPPIGTPNTLYNYDGTFDLTVNTPLITQGNSYVVSYYLTEMDAYNSVNPILTPTSFVSVTDTTVWVRAEDTNGCFSVISFEISTIVYIPDANFKNKLLQANTNNQIAKNAADQNIKIDTNNDGEIQVSEALEVYKLQIQQTAPSIQDLTGIEAFTNLIDLNCYSNNITELNLANNVNLTKLNCYYNELTSLDVSNNINLVYLDCYENNLTTLNVSNNTNLTYLSFAYNNITEINLSNNVNLLELYCRDTNLTELNLSNNISLTHLNCANIGLTELDVSNNVNLGYLACTYNNLTLLDVSNNPNIHTMVVNSNPLQYLNIKNGTSFSNVQVMNNVWSNLPNNIYICADKFEMESIQPFLNQSGATGQIISTYCSFNPAGDYNTITGTVTYDFNNNGCDEDDDITIFTKVAINDGTEEGVSFTNQNGEYKFFTQEGTFTLTPDLENPSFFNITPVTETITFTDNDNNEEIVNFCLTPNGVHNDLEVVVAPLIPARPGFEATYKIVYRNKGNQVMSQTNGISFAYDDDYMDFVSATQTPSVQSTGLLMWDYENLMPFESRSFVITIQINTPTNPDFPVNIDDVFTFLAVILPETGDENISDNNYGFRQIVVGSFDPNDITCIEGDVVEPEHIGEELHYVIRFENTGNFYAENVVVVMEIDTTKYDIDSVRLLNTSHNANAQIKDDVLEIFFNQIYLDSGGHGNILLVMKSINTLSEGDSVQSKADIYFDFNYPIITNDAVTLFQATMNIEENIKNIDLKFYPNPTTDYFNITSEAMIQSVELYDVSGRLVRTSLVNDFETQQNVSNLTNGVYLLKIKTQEGEITGKIVKK